MNTKELIAAYTGLSVEAQAERQFETAYEWLAVHLPEEPQTAESIPLTSRFWTWWNTQWEAIDLAFLEGLELDAEWHSIMVQVPGCDYKSFAHSEKHLGAVWADYHHVRYVGGGSYLLKKGVLNTIYTRIKQSLK